MFYNWSGYGLTVPLLQGTGVAIGVTPTIQQQQLAFQAYLAQYALAQQQGVVCTPDEAARLSNGYVPETPEQYAIRQAAWQARAAKVEVVRQKAEQLWMAQLTADERATWMREGYVDVRSEFGRRYRIRNHQSGNVFLLDHGGQPVRKYCAYAADPGGILPAGDYWFVQLETLKYNEREFLAKANTWDLRRNGLFVGQGVDAGVDEALPLAA